MAETTYKNGELGFWMSQTLHTPEQELTENIECDLAIVGGGFTGLWGAYFAKQLEPTLKIVVLEAEQIGYGASGRNGGWISALVPGNRKRFAAHTSGGIDASRAMQREFITSVDELLKVLDREGINADEHKGGTLSAAHTLAGLNRLVAKRDADLHYGMTENEVQLLDRSEFKSRINIDDVHGGLFYPNVARINPAKLVRGLAETLAALDVDIFEKSRVLSIDRGVVKLKSGSVRAGKVFICTEGYSGDLLGRRRLIPINSSMIVTRPLDAQAWLKIGWAALECLNDSAHTFIYAQRTADDRIAIGGRGYPYRFASGTGGKGKTSESTVRQLREKLHRFFPNITFEVEHAWSGVLGVTRDWNGSVTWDPAIGVGSSVGYAGHGVNAAFVGAHTLAELALDRVSQRTTLPWVGYTSKLWEVEPIRWLGVHAMYRLFAIADAQEESRGSRDTSAIAKLGSRLAGLNQ